MTLPRWTASAVETYAKDKSSDKRRGEGRNPCCTARAASLAAATVAAASDVDGVRASENWEESTGVFEA